MRLRNIPEAKPYLLAHPLVSNTPAEFSDAISNAADSFKRINLEIGVGKGRFILQKCLKYPEIFFAGIEHYSSVLYKAVQKFDENANNVIFACEDAAHLDDLIPKNLVDLIYINFPDPWPKARHENRRLLSDQYLERFARILKDGGRLYFKTDNRELFEFAINSLCVSRFKLDDLTYDLHNINGFFEDNIATEYEQRFLEKGQPIYAIKARLGREDNMSEINGATKGIIKGVIKADADSFKKIIADSKLPVLADFYADWCGPCKMMAPVMDKLAQTYEGKAVFVKVNIDAEQVLAQEYKVMSIPNFFIIKNGVAIDNIVGGVPESEIIKALEKAL